MTAAYADLSFEIELSLTGTFTPGYPATYEEPGQGDMVEDVDIEDIGIVSAVLTAEHERASHRFVWKTSSILDGIDTKNPEIRKLFANILALKMQDAEEAILEGMAD